jgi:hypothetical protein
VLNKHSKRLGLAILEDLEIFMPQTGDRIALTIGDDYIDEDFADFGLYSGQGCGVVLRVLRPGGSRGRRAEANGKDNAPKKHLCLLDSEPYHNEYSRRRKNCGYRKESAWQEKTV